MIIDQVPKDIAMTKMPKDEARLVILILFLVNFFSFNFSSLLFNLVESYKIGLV